MREIGSARQLILAQAGVRQDVKAMFQRMSSDIGTVIMRSTGGIDGAISRSREREIVAQVDQLVTRYFVGYDGRSAFGDDGVTPLAEYPRIINRWVARASKLAVQGQTSWLKRHIPEDVFNLLATTPKKAPAVREAYSDEERRQFREKVSDLYIFRENPLARYESAHTWVDPNGYRLSDRIWHTSQETRQKIDAMVADGIRGGMSSTRLAKLVEPFLLPGRVGVRTTRPYGRDASYNAMRLTRTEISHAHAQASYAAALTNPYVGAMDWALSLAHPKIDICDRLATIGMNGERIREPYPLESASIPPAHPHCLCNGRPAIKEDVQSVTARLRAAFEEAQRLEERPNPNPANTNEFLWQLLGRVLFEAIG